MNEKRPTAIYGIDKLRKDVDYYAKMFPNNHFTSQELIDQVKKESLSLNGCLVFGFSVSGEWKERCYCFKVLANNTELVEIEYLGIGKV